MKYIILSAAMAITSLTLKAQEKQEATIKIVVEENGKQKVIERHFTDMSKADSELKKFSDSLDLDIKVSGDKKKIIRMDVNKKSNKEVNIEKGGENIIIQRSEGGPGPRQNKRVMIIRGKDGETITENLQGPESLHMELDGPAPHENKRIMIIRGKDGETITENLQGPESFHLQLDGPGDRMKEFRKIHKNILLEGSKTIQGLNITPNKPFNGTLSIKFKAPEKGNVSISVLDVNGKEMATSQLKDFQGDYLGQVDIKKAGTGVYFVRVSQGNDGAVRRVKVD